jgi:sortase A
MQVAAPIGRGAGPAVGAHTVSACSTGTFDPMVDDAGGDVEVGAPELGPPTWPEIDVHPYRRSRDWRWWVGLVGRVLVVTGLLLLAFVAYQLWGTGIQTKQAQNRLSDQFADVLSTTTVAPATTTPPTTVPGSTTSPPTTPAPTAPPTTPPAPQLGDPVARLEIPKIDLDYIVVHGVGVDELKQGPGHYPDTPLPGHGGNVAIAGHRTTYGHPFYRINELDPGDEVILTTPAGRYVYKVTEQFIVAPTQSEVLAPTADAELTLTSCHPRYSARQRIIIKAKLDAAQSSPLVATAPPVTAPPATPPTSLAPVVPGSSTTAPATTTSVPTTIPGGDAVAAADDLQRGWFGDDAAWAPLVLWGLALIAICLGGWALRRKTGRPWLGVVVAALPFLFCLYFFFENVNRLLPPNI